MINIDGTIDGLKRIFSNYELDLPFTDSSDIESEIIVLLEELKELKKSAPNRRFYTLGYNAGYNKAIDDFAEKLIRYVDCGHLCSPTEVRWSDLSVVEMVNKLAEQLKVGDKE